MILIKALCCLLIILNIQKCFSCKGEKETSRCFWFETQPQLQLMNVSLFFDTFEGQKQIINMMYEVPQTKGCFRSENDEHSVTLCCCIVATEECQTYFEKFDQSLLYHFEPPTYKNLHWQAVPDTRPPKWIFFVLVALFVFAVTLAIVVILLLMYVCGCPCYDSIEKQNPTTIAPTTKVDQHVNKDASINDMPTPRPPTPREKDTKTFTVNMCPIPQMVPPPPSSIAESSTIQTNTMDNDQQLKKMGKVLSEVSFSNHEDTSITEINRNKDEKKTSSEKIIDPNSKQNK